MKEKIVLFALLGVFSLTVTGCVTPPKQEKPVVEQVEKKERLTKSYVIKVMEYNNYDYETYPGAVIMKGAASFGRDFVIDLDGRYDIDPENEQWLSDIDKYSTPEYFINRLKRSGFSVKKPIEKEKPVTSELPDANKLDIIKIEWALNYWSSEYGINYKHDVEVNRRGRGFTFDWVIQKGDDIVYVDYRKPGEKEPHPFITSYIGHVNYIRIAPGGDVVRDLLNELYWKGDMLPKEAVDYYNEMQEKLEGLRAK